MYITPVSPFCLYKPYEFNFNFLVLACIKLLVLNCPKLILLLLFLFKLVKYTTALQITQFVLKWTKKQPQQHGRKSASAKHFKILKHLQETRGDKVTDTDLTNRQITYKMDETCTVYTPKYKSYTATTVRNGFYNCRKKAEHRED